MCRPNNGGFQRARPSRGSTKPASRRGRIRIHTHLVDELVDIEAFGDAACHALLSKLDKPIDDTLLGVEAAQTFAASFRNAFEPALINKATCNLLPDYLSS